MRTVLDLELGECARDVTGNGLLASAEVCRNLQVVASPDGEPLQTLLRVPRTPRWIDSGKSRDEDRDVQHADDLLEDHD